MLCPQNGARRYSLVFPSFSSLCHLLFSASSRHDFLVNLVQSLSVFQTSKRSRCKRMPRFFKSHWRVGLESNQWEQMRPDQVRPGQAKKQRYLWLKSETRGLEKEKESNFFPSCLHSSSPPPNTNTPPLFTHIAKKAIDIRERWKLDRPLL